jgi:UDP-N-acetylglucosamine--N-acetylmuramyl-(pentapeptide) pyrophosphoryl-undecaprenol N-acetylglucosamine transferase
MCLNLVMRRCGQPGVVNPFVQSGMIRIWNQVVGLEMYQRVGKSEFAARIARSWMTSDKVCLAASGGGHVRQLLDLENIWADLNVFFVTEPTALGESIAQKYPTHFVDHFAWGQARLGNWGLMFRSAFKNLTQAAMIIRRQKPKIIVTTGAGSMAPLVIFGRLTGAKIILIDSFARFRSPSLFARLAGWLAHVRIAQSKESGAKWHGALVFDPFVRLDGPRPTKESLAFATVGATLAFPRMVEWVARAHEASLLPIKLIVQTGVGGIAIPGAECHEALPFDQVGEILDKAEIVICHGGTGSIITALQRGCHVIVVPREFSMGEHYDDHQTEIANAFAERGLIQVARSFGEFEAAIMAVPTRTPQLATTDPRALGKWLRNYIEQAA